MQPQRGARSRAPARQQQGAGGVLPEPRGEEGGPRELLGDQVGHLVRVEQQLLHIRRTIRLGQTQSEALVTMDRLHLQAGALAQPRLHRQRPGGVHPSPVTAEHADAPVAELVAEALDDNALVVGQRAGDRHLLIEVGEQVAGGAAVEAGALAQPGDARVAGAAPLACQPAHRQPDLDRPSQGVAVPEGDPSRLARGRRHQHL